MGLIAYLEKLLSPLPALVEGRSRESLLFDSRWVVEEALGKFRERYREVLWSGHKAIDRVVSYLSRTQGKGIRPTLTLLCASLNGERPSEQAIDAAVIVELLHEATLVHDDVVDGAVYRRGFLSLPARFHNKVAVLFGDYILATVLSETLSARDFRWLDILSQTARRLARGELLQATRSRRMDMTVEDYLHMVEDKTGSLFNASCQLGGVSAGFADGEVKRLGEFGDLVGVAFQIKDDLLDLFGGEQTGKPRFNDLKEKKITLPLLLAFQRSPNREGNRVRAMIRRGIRGNEIDRVVRFIKRYEGDEEAVVMMRERLDNAREKLATFTSTPAREALLELTHFIEKRDR